MIIVSESTDNWDDSEGGHPDLPTRDMCIPPPYLKRLTEQQQREALVNLIGGFLA